MTEPLDLLRANGDLFERHAFNDSEFAAEFDLYPRVWARYILPNRDASRPGLVTPEWGALAEHHYSAIVRCWSARIARNRVDEFCTAAIDDLSAPRLIDIHDAVFAYFTLCCAALENLSKCFKCSPLNQLMPDDGVETDEGSPAWFYHKRNGLVHSMLVPIGLRDGVPVLNDEVFEKGVGWHTVKGTETSSASDFIADSWPKFVGSMRGWWSQLLGRLDLDQPSASGAAASRSALFGAGKPIPYGAGSGNPGDSPQDLDSPPPGSSGVFPFK